MTDDDVQVDELLSLIDNLTIANTDSNAALVWLHEALEKFAGKYRTSRKNEEALLFEVDGLRIEVERLRDVEEQVCILVAHFRAGETKSVYRGLRKLADLCQKTGHFVAPETGHPRGRVDPNAQTQIETPSKKKKPPTDPNATMPPFKTR